MATEASDAPVGKRERNKADKLRRIHDAAVALFDELGFEATTTAAIAERAGIGAGTLYLYVGSKDELLVSVFRERAGRAWADAFGRNDRSARVDQQLLGIFSDVATTHAGELRLASPFFRSLQFVDEPTRAGADELLREIYEQLVDVMTSAQAAGGLDREVEPRVLAENLFASWFVLMQRLTAGRTNLDEVLRRLRDSFELAFRGLLR